MDLSKLSLSDKIVAACGLVLVIDLLFFPWHSVDLGIVSFTRTAVESPNGFWGILGLLLTIAVVAITLVQVFSPDTKLPELPVTWKVAIFYGSAATLAVLFLKLVIETDSLGFGAWLGLILAGGMTYGGFLKFQEDRAQRSAI